MADYYNTYKRSIIDEVVKYTKLIYPGQLLTFIYGSSSEVKIVLTIGVWDKKIHCLKLNGINPTQLKRALIPVISNKLINDYETAISYGIYDEVIRVNEYQLPLKIPRLGGDTTAKTFYTTVVARSPLFKNNSAYRTYRIDETKRLRVVVPDLQKLGFLDRRVKRRDVSMDDKLELLERMREQDDYTKRRKFDEQDEQFD